MTEKTGMKKEVVESNGGVSLDKLHDEHRVAQAIDEFVHRARDIKFAARVFVPAAAQIIEQQYKDLEKSLEKGERLSESENSAEKAYSARLITEELRKGVRLTRSQLPDVVETSLFLSLFSAFDAYTGELLRALHVIKPELFARLNRAIPLSEVLAAKGIEELKKSVLDDEVETFRRKSYVEQFEYLETAFGLPLRKFEKWADFVEAAQRRNLLTHCGGVVSEQYRDQCKKQGYPVDKLPSVGEVIDLGAEYFLPTCELMIEVGVKLGQTLWRKLVPEDLEACDDHLQEVIYDALTVKQWRRAEVLAEFAVNQKAVFNDVTRRIGIINFAIALKNLGRHKELVELVGKTDWSATIGEFKLAQAVLLDRFEDAVVIMSQIGPKGDFLTETSYHTWPLFNEFREREDFRFAYEKLYGYPFLTKLKEKAEAVKQDAHEQMERLGKRSEGETMQEIESNVGPERQRSLGPSQFSE